jgi:hypothetical protein
LEDRSAFYVKKNKPIKKSHIISKLFFRRAKANAAIRTFRESSNLTKKLQDGIRADYLCTVCEGKLKETEFAKLYDIVHASTSNLFHYDGDLLTFALSLFFRTFKYRTDDQNRREADLSTLLNKLRIELYDNIYKDFPVQSNIYLCILSYLDQSKGFIPGINQAISAPAYDSCFTLNIGGSQKWCAIIKVQEFCFLYSEYDLSKVIIEDMVPIDVDKCKIYPKGGMLDSSFFPEYLLSLIRPKLNKLSSEIVNYHSNLTPKELKDLKTEINKNPSPTTTNAHKDYEADLKLLHEKYTELSITPPPSGDKVLFIDLLDAQSGKINIRFVDKKT